MYSTTDEILVRGTTKLCSGNPIMQLLYILFRKRRNCAFSLVHDGNTSRTFSVIPKSGLELGAETHILISELPKFLNSFMINVTCVSHKKILKEFSSEQFAALSFIQEEMISLIKN